MIMPETVTVPRSTPAEVWPALWDVMVETRLMGKQFLHRRRLTIGQAMTLHWIERDRGLRLSELAEGLGISRPAATSLVDLLAAQGWVVRERSTTDRREVRVRLAARGQRVLDSLEEEMERSVREAIDALPSSVRAPLASSLPALARELRARRERLSAHSEGAGPCP